MLVCAIVSFRLGMADGVSVVAAQWQRALTELGFTVLTVAGDGPVDRTIRSLAIDAGTAPDERDVRAALDDADLVVVENLCTIPMNLPASRAVARVLAGRPALVRHHDPPWQLPRFAHVTELPLDDPAWRHVVINEHTRHEFAARGIRAERIYNGFEVHPAPGDRDATRRKLDVADDERLVVHPVRAIPRKNIPRAIEIATALDATYWLLGPSEDGYGDDLAAALATARCRVVHEPSPGSMEDAYAAADLVVFPSTREGFGNPPVEAAIHRRPAIVGRYDVATELRAFGFRWFDATTDEGVDAADAFLRAPDATLLEHNRRVAVEHFSHDRVRDDLEALLAGAGWLP